MEASIEFDRNRDPITGLPFGESDTPANEGYATQLLSAYREIEQLRAENQNAEDRAYASEKALDWFLDGYEAVIEQALKAREMAREFDTKLGEMFSTLERCSETTRRTHEVYKQFLNDRQKIRAGNGS